MTDRIKGYLVILEGDIRDDDAQCIEDAIKMIRHVCSVKAYVKGAEDYMMETRARNQLPDEMIRFLMDKRE